MTRLLQLGIFLLTAQTALERDLFALGQKEQGREDKVTRGDIPDLAVG
jgi:hypothetical protein